MNIEIHDMALEIGIQKQIQATGAGNAEEALLRLLETRKSRIVGFWKTALRSTRKFGAASNNSTAARESRKTNATLTWLT
jgi:hypothetical protein